MKTPHIAIVGSGLGGPTLARILQQHGIPSTLYELEADLHARHQGGLLDIHQESGQRALREAGLLEAFQRHVLQGGEDMRVLNAGGTVLHDEVTDGRSFERPEINRSDLRDLLVNSLDQGRVAWGHKLTAAMTLPDGRHQLTFDDGSTITPDLVVGSDGAWSRVRRLLSSAVPCYSGVSFLELNLWDVDQQWPRAAAKVGRGMTFALAEGRGFLTHQGADGSVHVYAALKVPEDWLESCGTDWADAPAARARLLREFAGWDDALLDLIRGCDDQITPRAIYELPTHHSWPRVPGVTLLGDAAHLMSPFAGEGANLALQDATELALAIISHPGDLEAALAEYEAALFPRSAAAAEMSAQSLEICFRSDAPQGLLDLFAGFQEERGEQVGAR